MSSRGYTQSPPGGIHLWLTCVVVCFVAVDIQALLIRTTIL